VRCALAFILCVAACRSTAPPPGAEPEELGVEVRFEGLDEMSQSVLEDAALRELRAFVENGRRPADAADAAYSMELALRDNGYPHGTVEFTVERAALLFTVQEGVRVYFDGVEFPEIEDVEERAELREYFTFPGSGTLGTGDPYFRLADVEGAAGKVQTHFLLRGYLRVELLEPEITYSDDKTRARATIRVEKGPQYTVRSVTFQGLEPRDLGLIGKPYHVRVPAEAAGRLRRDLLDAGHQRQQVASARTIDHDAAVADITLTVTPGPRVRLGKLRFSGQEKTKEWFLRRRIPLREADYLAQRLIDRGVGNLYRTGLFAAVRPSLVDAGPDVSDLEIRLDELPARSVDVELGYGSYELARGAVRYRNQNFLRIGRRLGIEGRASVRSLGAEIDIEDPYLLGGNRTLELNAGYLLREEPSFDRESLQFELVVTQRFTSQKWKPYRFRFGYRLRVEQARNAPPDLVVDALTEGFTRTAGLFVSARRDTRDTPLIPNWGTLAEVALLWSAPGLGADLEFLEVDLRVSRFTTLRGRTVLGVTVRVIAREILNDDGNLPIQERLFLGGESDVRSFFESELGPGTTGEPLGGLTSAYATIELRRQVWEKLHVGLFYDIGMVAPRAWTVFGPPGHAVGLGARYYLPVGPIRLDVAYNPGRRFTADQSWAIHLAFGFSF